MKYALLAFFSAVGILNLQADINPGIDLNKEGVTLCVGGPPICYTGGIGTAGALFTIDPKQELVTQFGTISQEVTQKLPLPEKIDGHTLFSFVPKEGEGAGKTIYLAFRLNEKGRPGTRLAGMYPLELFRLMPGQDSKKGWDRVGEFALKSTQSRKETPGETPSFTFTFMPNGNVSVVDSKGTRKEILYK
jgi:hypothetical protein